MAGKILPDKRNVASNLERLIYNVNENNWYQSLPYGFIYTPKKSKTASMTDRETLWLPISPQNLTVVTRYATNIVTTLYGVVEEHSEIRYYEVTIQGTTGYSPRYVDKKVKLGDEEYLDNQAKPGRMAYGPEFAINVDASGFFNQTMEIANQISNKASDLKNKMTGTGSDVIGGVSPFATGYMAFHNLYRFLHKYKKDASNNLDAQSEERKFHPLTFINYKDGIEYDCVPTNFTLVRSAESPMLYNYNITMRCYNMREIGKDSKDMIGTIADGFGVAAYGQEIKQQSNFAKIQDAVSDAKAIIGSLAGGLGILGR